MSRIIYLETDRLFLRAWQNDDLDPFAEMCADPDVMRYFPDTMSRERSGQQMKKAREKQESDGFCFAPADTRDTGEFLGFVGLSKPSYGKSLPFDPCVEIGWRLRKSAWEKVMPPRPLRPGFDSVLKLSD